MKKLVRIVLLIIIAILGLFSAIILFAVISDISSLEHPITVVMPYLIFLLFTLNSAQN
jgi:hypothetical protein